MKHLLVICVLAATVSAVAETKILSPEDGRVWQTVFHPSDPLEWRWEDGAVSATVTVTDLVAGQTREPVQVARGVGNYGSFVLTGLKAPAEGGESLADVTLVQNDEGGAVLSTQTARLAYLPGANGGAITVAKFNPSRATIKESRAIADDAAWTADAAGDAKSVFTPEGEAEPVATELAGRSGYYPVAAKAGHLELVFGKVTYLETWLRASGLVLLFR